MMDNTTMHVSSPFPVRDPILPFPPLESRQRKRFLTLARTLAFFFPVQYPLKSLPQLQPSGDSVTAQLFYDTCAFGIAVVACGSTFTVDEVLRRCMILAL